MSSTTPRPFVLLVEDSEDDAFFFKRALRQSGYAGEVTHVDDGGQAVSHLTQAIAGEVPVPDLVFLDLKIPTLSGFDVLTWVRTQAFAPPLEIAVLSGSEQGDDVKRALALGAAAYYVKPIRVDQLNLRIDAWQRNQTTGIPRETAHVARGPDGPDE